jgi:hypothetical protein
MQLFSQALTLENKQNAILLKYFSATMDTFMSYTNTSSLVSLNNKSILTVLEMIVL